MRFLGALMLASAIWMWLALGIGAVNFAYGERPYLLNGDSRTPKVKLRGGYARERHTLAPAPSPTPHSWSLVGR